MSSVSFPAEHEKTMVKKVNASLEHEEAMETKIRAFVNACLTEGYAPSLSHVHIEYYNFFAIASTVPVQLGRYNSLLINTKLYYIKCTSQPVSSNPLLNFVFFIYCRCLTINICQ